MNIQFPGHVAKLEVAPKGKVVVTVHGESKFLGTDLAFEVPSSALPEFQPGAEVVITIAAKER